MWEMGLSRLVVCSVGCDLNGCRGRIGRGRREAPVSISRPYCWGAQVRHGEKARRGTLADPLEPRASAAVCRKVPRFLSGRQLTPEGSSSKIGSCRFGVAGRLDRSLRAAYDTEIARAAARWGLFGMGRRAELRPEWRNGRRAGLKIRSSQEGVGSTPTSGTVESFDFRETLRFVRPRASLAWCARRLRTRRRRQWRLAAPHSARAFSRRIGRPTSRPGGRARLDNMIRHRTRPTSRPQVGTRPCRICSIFSICFCWC